MYHPYVRPIYTDKLLIIIVVVALLYYDRENAQVFNIGDT